MVTPRGCVSFPEAMRIIVGDEADSALRSAESDALTQALFDGMVRAKFLNAQTGTVFALPSGYWATPRADAAKKGDECSTYLGSGWSGHHPVHGRVFIVHVDVERWAARRASAVAEHIAKTQNAAVDGARTSPEKTNAQRAARAYVLQDRQGWKVTQDKTREHVERLGHSVADADPGEWWREFKADPETAERIATRGRPPKNPAENRVKKSCVKIPRE